MVIGMNSDNETVYGAFVCVFIRFDGNLEQLADKLAKTLRLESFYFKTDQDPPHKKVGLAESLGWESWLETNSGNPPFNYRFSMETQNCYSELDEGRMHDLSPWFAQFLMSATKIDATPGPWRRGLHK